MLATSTVNTATQESLARATVTPVQIFRAKGTNFHFTHGQELDHLQMSIAALESCIEPSQKLGMRPWAAARPSDSDTV